MLALIMNKIILTIQNETKKILCFLCTCIILLFAVGLVSSRTKISNDKRAEYELKP